MIPRLPLQENLKPEYTQFLEALARSPFSGEIRSDFASRLILSTDNSIYQILPQSVVFPKTDKDIVQLFSLAKQDPFKTIAFSPRGGGTGTNGQSLSSGLVIDCSKFMDRVLELNLEDGWVRVQPGVVLDQLNAKLKPYGRCFAPSIAPSSRATIGGMINTDACGKGSRIYGRTSNHILELSWVLSDGTVGRSQAIEGRTLSHLKQQPGRLGEIYRQVDKIVTSKRSLIQTTFPKMPRFMTGYNLAKVSSDTTNCFNLNWIIAGSEGTLAVVTEAKLKLTPIPKFKQLLVVRYHSFDEAIASAQRLLEADPAAIETVDEKILSLAKQDHIYNSVKAFIAEANAINLVEFVGSDRHGLQQQVSQVCQTLKSKSDLDGPATGYSLAQEEEDIAQLWELRKKGVGLLANTQGDRKPVPFIEDTAVPPLCLANYIQEFKALLTQYKLDYAMFGHVDVGCIHVRPALDLKVPKDEQLVRELSDQVVALVRRYGGVMWGEHGKGFRSEYTPAFFGEELYQDLRKIKAAFDPENRLNPGKIVTPFKSSDEVVRVEAPLRGHFDRQVQPSLRSQYEVAFSCNGNGACFNLNADAVMCPSYKGMRHRIHSPKGRASLLREWLRQLDRAKVEDGDKPGSFPAQLWNTLTKVWGVYDYSHEVYNGMDGCLGCKACASQCPVQADIPSLKAKFLALYHTRYLRPWRDYLVAHIETLASWQSRLPVGLEAMAQTPMVQWMLKGCLGLVDPPVASSPTVVQGLADGGIPTVDLDCLWALTIPERANSVILVQDALTSFYDSQLVLETCDFLRHLGYSVYVAPFFASGKPLHVKGFLKSFEAIARKNAAYLSQLGQLGIPLIGIEPSIVLTYRDEYVKLLDPSKPLPPVQLLQEFLVTQLHRLPSVSTSDPYYLLSHCSEKTMASASGQQWQQVFEAMGLSLIPLATGCCGMAGSYGHEAEHYATSGSIYQMSWGQKLPPNSHQRPRFVVTGYSCRSQVRRFEGWTPLHPVQALQGYQKFWV